MHIPYNYINSILKDDDFSSIVTAIIDRLDNYDTENDEFDEELYQCISDELIYYDDQWTILKYYYYNDIQNADFNQALENLYCTIAVIIKKYKEVK